MIRRIAIERVAQAKGEEEGRDAVNWMVEEKEVPKERRLRARGRLSTSG